MGATVSSYVLAEQTYQRFLRLCPPDKRTTVTLTAEPNKSITHDCERPRILQCRGHSSAESFFSFFLGGLCEGLVVGGVPVIFKRRNCPGKGRIYELRSSVAGP